VAGRPFVNPLRLCGIDAGALPITDEAELHLGDHARHSQYHAARRTTGIDGRLEHPEACSLLFPFVENN